MNQKTREMLQAHRSTVAQIIADLAAAREEEMAWFETPGEQARLGALSEKTQEDVIVALHVQLNGLQLIEEHLEEVAEALGKTLSQD